MHASTARRLNTLLGPLLLLLASAIVIPAAAAPAVQGMPLLQRFGPDDYQAGATNLAVLASPDGIVYVGNQSGLLYFDGTQWRLLELPRRSLARALAMDPQGRLFVGGYDQFGMVQADPTGTLVFEDLRPLFGLDPEQVAFGNVWDVVRSDDGVYFRTKDQMFFLADDGDHKTWPVDERARQLYAIGRDIYARIHGVGLSLFDDSRFQPIPGGELFANQPLIGIFKDDDGLVLLGTDGFMRASASGITIMPGNAAAVFAEAEPYSGITLPGGGYLLGTHGGELLHFSADLQLLARHRIGRFMVLDLALDRESGVWAATEGDLLRLRVPAAWTLFNAGNGLPGSVYDSAFHQGALWIATSQGVYKAQAELGAVTFEMAIETVLEASVLLPDPSGLLVGDREGLLLLPVEGGPPLRIAHFDTAVDLRRSKFDRDLLLAFGETELLALRRRGADWGIEQRWPLGGVGVGELYEAGPHELWIGDYRGGVIRWILDPATGAIVERREFGAADGLHVDAESGTTMNELDGILYATSGRRSFRRDGARFVEVDAPPFNLVERPWELEVVETSLGAYAYTSRELLRRTDAGSWVPVHLGVAVARGYSHLHVGADGLIRLLTWNGLLQFDPGVSEPEQALLEVGLRSLQMRMPDGRVERLPLAQAREPITLPPGAVLQIDPRLLSMEPGSEFRFRIDGLIDAWSQWEPATGPALVVRHAGPGRYRVEIEGRTRSGRLAQPLQLVIDAAPRWWQTGVAGVFGLLLLLLLIGASALLVARIRYRQFVATNQRLERRIAERTAELEQANQKLADLATEDSLTGVANRRALEQAMVREWARCRDLSQPLSVVMVDVDHFKQFNDVHGHLAGDQQLIRVARLLAEHVRPVSELLARFGGEEFALVLPGLTQEQAMQRAETIRRSMAGTDRGADSRLTISAGVACVVPGPRMVPDDLIRAADMALYAAKRGGRNRVMAASEPRNSPA
jgi:diguanylate cyclase (GGDEF)-like protein